MINVVYKGITMKGIVETIKLIIYALFAYLEIPIEAFIILVVFISLDTFLGAIAAIRMGDKFSFKILLWGWGLKVATLLLPLLVAGLAKVLDFDFTILVVLTIKILTVSEFYSCIGNIYMAKNKIRVNKVDVVSGLLKSLRVFAKNILDKLLKKIEQSADCEKNK